MATKLTYLDDFDVVRGKAIITDMKRTEDERVDIQLNATCFYPRGGGQDWDEGVIKNPKTSTLFTVEEVRLDEQGIVHHLGTFCDGDLKVGDTVECDVDRQRRELNTRLHSAGHMIDLAVDTLKLPWRPFRGAHYPHMSFVEYEGALDPDQAASIAGDITKVANDVIREGGENEIRFMPIDQMHTVCRHVPPNIPRNKPARVVIYHKTFGVPCGGTHLKNLHEIGAVEVTKIKAKKGLIKVSYSLQQAD